MSASILNIKERFSQRIKESEAVASSEPTPSESTPIERHCIKEEDVGISEYLSDLPGFSGVIKQRYTDFIVREIALNGEKAILNSVEIPKISDDILENVDDDLAQEHAEEILKVINGDIDVYKIDLSDGSKDDRKKLHLEIKNRFGTQVISNTVINEESKILCVTKASGSKKEDRWRGPHYLHFILCKWNTDLTTALDVISSKIRIKSSKFTICGTKDKRAVSSQWICVRHLKAERLAGLNKHLRNMATGNYKYMDTPLQLGDLIGNNFEIVLRNVSDQDIAEASLEKLKTVGFVNYFGLQRFGKCAESATYLVGKALIQGCYLEAIDLILQPKNLKEDYRSTKAREIWMRTKDPAEAMKVLSPNIQSIESKLLAGLAKHGLNAPLNALDFLPRNVLLMYLHSYQSLLWNKVLSQRLKKYGTTVLEGDLVQENIDVELGDNGEKTLPTPRIITSDEVSSWDITSVLHPIPGYEVVYPKNEVATWFHEALAADGLTSDMLMSRVRQFSLRGTYRLIVKRPRNITWRFARYSSANNDLLVSDHDRMRGIAPLDDEGEKQFLAAIITMDLDSSTYATMALREILRSDTSVNHQSSLNTYDNHGKKRSNEDNEDGTESRKKR